MSAYYNEFDPFAAAWLRELIKAGHIAPGDVDERSIVEVKADDLKGYTQCHFFAGIGGWSRALRLAGWDDSRPVWTGSAPCQPFSSAGKQKGKADIRHLFPVWLGLIEQCRPPVIFGEQVSSAIAHGWLDDVYQGLEAEGYAVGSAVLPACSVGAPHRRDRLWFVAHANDSGCAPRSIAAEGARYGNTPKSNGGTGFMADTSGRRCSEPGERKIQQSGRAEVVGASKDAGALAHTDGGNGHWWSGPLQVGWNCIKGEITRSSGVKSAQWLIKPGLSLLANGVPNRVGKLRGYGNAIVPQVAAQFIKAASM